MPVISKTFEKIIHNRLSEYLTSINFISDCQYGFRPKSNTLAATIDLITKIKRNIDAKNLGLGLFIDLKKAFDSISHSLLLKKISHIGITGTAYKIFENYLRNRNQIVKINQYQSSPQPITYGVPQGSILGPLLFLIYIHNITDLKLHGEISLYADDTCIFYFGHSLNEIIPRAQSDLNILNKWFQSNLLTINTSKTSHLIFKPKNNCIYSPFTIK